MASVPHLSYYAISKHPDVIDWLKGFLVGPGRRPLVGRSRTEFPDLTGVEMNREFLLIGTYFSESCSQVSRLSTGSLLSFL